MIPKLEKLEALDDFCLYLEYSDGSKGNVSLKKYAGKGVFEIWDDYDNFKAARIADSGEVCWSDSLDMCADGLYFELTGKAPSEVIDTPERKYA